VALSKDPAKRKRQLANLRRGGTNPAGGRPPAHGAYAVIARERLEKREADVFGALASDAPLRNADGSLPGADAVLVRLLAECLCRLDSVASYLRDRGMIDDAGNVRPAVEVEGRLRREAADHAEALGMSPRARSKIGMDLIRAEVAAQSVGADREARERLDRRLASLDADAEDTDAAEDVVDAEVEVEG
jgi:hypothetical protein